MDLNCLIQTAISVYTLILFVRIILSWVTMFWSPSPALTPIIRVIYELTEPVMALFRRYIPPIGGLDISPLIIFVILRLLAGFFPC
ncbi:MAG: YggT family protein [Actinomycetota bacterium]|nr:YggT family protein [Actinomycetota bacterium]